MGQHPRPQQASLLTIQPAGLVAVLLFACLVTGCARSPQTAVLTDSQKVTQSEDRFDAGTICAGEPISHKFTFVNITGEELRIVSDTDIVVGCGCTSLSPSARVVAPGDQIELALIVNTERLGGKFAYRSAVTWTGAKGPLVHNVMVTGQAVPLLTLSPDELSFGPGEWGEGKSKSVLVTGNEYVTLQHWRAVAGGHAMTVSKVETIDDRTARIHVTCANPGDLEVVTATVNVTAAIKSCQRQIATNEAAITFPTKGQQPVEFSIRPAQLTVLVDPQTRRGKGALFLKGQGLKDKTVEVRCGDHKTTCKLTATSPETGVLSVEIDGIASESLFVNSR